MMLHVQHQADRAGVTLAWTRLGGLPLRTIQLVGLVDHPRVVA
jgi:hypothetical protein